MFIDDFSDFTGKFADIDNDGKVDLAEYLNETYEYNQIMNDDDDYDFDDDNEDNFSLDEDDVIYEDFDCEENNSENYNHNGINRTTVKDKNNIEEYYFDDVYKHYCVGRAVYENFRQVAENFELEETAEDIHSVIYKIYHSDKKLALDILIWIINNFKKVLAGADVEEGMIRYKADYIIDSLISVDIENGDNFMLEYIYKNPEFEKKVLGEQFFDSRSGWLDQNYFIYLINKNDFNRFKKVYYTFYNNPNLNRNKYLKDKFIEDIIFHCSINNIENADSKYYTFLKEEIYSLGKPIKIKYLMDKLNERRYDKPIFINPDEKADKLKLIEEQIAKTETKLIENKCKLENLKQQKAKLVDKKWDKHIQSKWI